MSLWEWLATVAGVATVLLVILDVALTVLHPDVEGPLARAVQRATWDLVRRPARRLGRDRARGLLAAGGPLMLIATFAAWFALFVVGFALVVWPVIDSSFTTDIDRLRRLGLVDALYYSGGTGAVLGFGDITPVTGVMQLLAVAQAGMGFALLTAAVTFIISVLEGVGDRNGFALRLRHELGDDGDGADLVREWLDHENVAAVARRLDELAEALSVVEERLHRFPLVSLLYRSRRAFQDPEPALERVTGVAIAANLVAWSQSPHTLRPAARRLERALADSVQLLADQHVAAEARDRIRDPEPGDDDAELVDDIGERLREHLGPGGIDSGRRDELLALAARMRILLSELDRLTLWRESGRGRRRGAAQPRRASGSGLG